MARRWLVFVHQMPARPSNGRVKIWRRLQQLGAVALKNAVHVLPDSAQAVEDFEWLREEVLALGGEASVFTVSSMSDADERYVLSERKERKAMQTIEREPSAPKRRSTQSPKSLDTAEYRNRVWVTRPRPGVDRFASAWLIRRFIDPKAAFVFAASPDRYPDAVPFDMYQTGGFKHEGDLCTFEVLQERFGIRDRNVRRIAEIVHDVDLKEDRYKSPHAPTISALVDGLRASIPEDVRLLEQGMLLFEAFFQSLQSSKPVRDGNARIC